MVTGRARQVTQQDKPVIPLSQPPAASRSRRATCDAQLTGAPVREVDETHNVINIENRTHVYRNIFDHRSIENHLLQQRK